MGKIPSFKNKYIKELILKKGKCYTAKKQALKVLSNDSQKVVFAVVLDKKTLPLFKDLSEKNNLLYLENKKQDYLILEENTVITTEGDKFKTVENFLKIYEETDKSIEVFIEEKEEELKNSKKQKNISKPKKRIK